MSADDITVFLTECVDGILSTEARTQLTKIRRIARRLHKIYERQCNGYQDRQHNWDQTAADADIAQETLLERELRLIFTAYDLGLYLNTDPRGNPVGILTPRSGRYNTMGGASDGWRL